jgi:hypothetical protein
MYTTTHSFILEPGAETSSKDERRTGFNAEADERFATFATTGESIPWEAMKEYLQNRMAAKTT